MGRARRDMIDILQDRTGCHVRGWLLCVDIKIGMNEDRAKLGRNSIGGYPYILALSRSSYKLKIKYCKPILQARLGACLRLDYLQASFTEVFLLSPLFFPILEAGKTSLSLGRWAATFPSAHC